jgi:hypothetical protein
MPMLVFWVVTSWWTCRWTPNFLEELSSFVFSNIDIFTAVRTLNLIQKETMVEPDTCLSQINPVHTLIPYFP